MHECPCNQSSATMSRTSRAKPTPWPTQPLGPSTSLTLTCLPSLNSAIRRNGRGSSCASRHLDPYDTGSVILLSLKKIFLEEGTTLFHLFTNIVPPKFCCVCYRLHTTSPPSQNYALGPKINLNSSLSPIYQVTTQIYFPPFSIIFLTIP